MSADDTIQFGATREIRDAAARMFGVDPALIPGRSRKKEVVRARHAGIWAIKTRWPNLSYPQIAMRFGGRDHSTIMGAMKRIEERRKTCDATLRATDLLVTMPLGRPPQVPQDLLDRLAEQAAEDRARREKPGTEFYRRERAINSEILAYPEPKVSLLKLGLAGEAGDPLRDAAEIERRREAVVRQRRARELALLEAERCRYGLPMRAKPLSEMVL